LTEQFSFLSLQQSLLHPELFHTHFNIVGPT